MNKVACVGQSIVGPRGRARARHATRAHQHTPVDVPGGPMMSAVSFLIPAPAMARLPLVALARLQKEQGTLGVVSGVGFGEIN